MIVQSSIFNFLRRQSSFNITAVAAVIIALTILLPALLFGIPYFPDQVHHYQIASVYAQAISNGDFFPSWSASENFGFGGLGIRLYPPLPYYVLALFQFLTGEWYWSSLITYAFWHLLGIFGIYLLAKEFYSPKISLFSMVAFALMPYRFFELYAATMYGEFAGCSILPFSFYFAHRLCRKISVSNIIGLAFSFAVLILTHLPLTIIGSICLLVFSIASIKRGQIIKTVSALACSVIGALILSAFFWTRVLTEKNWVAGNSVYPLPQLDYAKNFIFTLNDGDLRIEYFDLFFLLPLFFILISFSSQLLMDRRNYKASLSLLAVFLFSSLMMVKISSPVWQFVPFLQDVQFPWRFLTITAVAGSILATAGWQNLEQLFNSSKRPLVLLMFGSFFILTAFSFFQVAKGSTFMPKDEFTQWRNNNDKEVGLEFWWTIWARREAVRTTDPVYVENREIKIEKWSSNEREFYVSEGNSNEARVAVFYYPYWQATVNDIQVEVRRSMNGEILIDLPPENSAVKLFFQEPLWLRTVWKISGIAWLILAILGIFQIKRFFSGNKIKSSAT